MSDPKRLLVSVGFGVLAVLSVLPGYIGLLGLVGQIRGYLTQSGERHVLAVILALVLVLAGGAASTLGTMFLNRRRPFIQNIWLVAGAIAALGLFAICVDVITSSVSTFETLFNLAISAAGVCLLYVSITTRRIR